MKNPITLQAATLGLLAGTLAIAPIAHAQITVQGGTAEGQAAFFEPDMDAADNVRLFDLNIQRLRLETSSGNTSTAAFTPSAARFVDADSSGTANVSDTGTIQGFLAGVAFTEGGTPIPFTGVPTVLDFTLTSFDNNIATLNGALISADQAGAAPLIFLPGVENINVLTDGYTGTIGNMEVGDFEADLDDGRIALPSTLAFRDSGQSPTIPSTSIAGRFRFDFRGNNVTPEEGSDFDVSDGDLRFIGAANREFRIRSAGQTRGRDGFKLDIRADVGVVDITLGDDETPLDESFRQLRIDGSSVAQGGNDNDDDDNDFDDDSDFDDDDFGSENDDDDDDVSTTSLPSTIRDVIDPERPLNYDIKGDAEGLFAFYNTSTYGFASTGRNNTRFNFDQRGDDGSRGRIQGRTQRDGSTRFFAAAGVSDFDSSFDFDDFDAIEFDGGGDDFDDSASCNICGDVATPETIALLVPVTFQPLVTSINLGTSFVFSTTSSTSTDLFVPVHVSSRGSRNYQYQFLTTYRFTNITTSNFSSISVRLLQLQGNTYYVVLPGQGGGRGRQVVTAFRQVGPGARIFPGLAGFAEVDADELEGTVLVGLEEIDGDGFTVDDSDDDDADDFDDDDDDSDDDDSDDLDDDNDDSDDDDDDSDDDDADDFGDDDDDSDDDDSDDLDD